MVKHVEQTAADGKPNRESFVLAVLEPYSHFGEMSFFHPAPHSADVRAQTAVTAAAISYADYKDLIDEGIMGGLQAGVQRVESLAERLRRMDEWIAELLAHKPHQRATIRGMERLSARSCSTTGIL